jgi:hypothetical protein
VEMNYKYGWVEATEALYIYIQIREGILRNTMIDSKIEICKMYLKLILTYRPKKEIRTPSANGNKIKIK